MKRFELQSETDTHYRVRHPAGHLIEVAKKGARPEVVKAIGLLPKMADGGEVPVRITADPEGPGMGSGSGVPPVAPDVPLPEIAPPDPSLQYGPVNFRPLPGGQPVAAPPEASPARQPAAPETPPANQGPGMPALPPLPQLPGYPSAGLERGISTMLATGRAGAEQKAAAEAQQAQDMTAAYQEHVANLKQVETKRQADLASVQQEINAAQDDVKNFRVDPSHFWSSRSAGQKITALIGVALGGLGSALTGQQNTAMQVIQASIDRDIDAQKLEMGKKENLVGMLYRKYGNVDEAANAARSYLMAAVAGQAGLAAARSGGQAAQANAKLLESQLQANALGPMAQIVNGKYQAETARYQLAWQQRMMQYAMQQTSGQQGGGEYLPSRAPPPMGSDPMNPLKYRLEAQKDAAERTLVGPGGRPFLAYDKESAGKARPMLQSLQVARKLLSDLKALRENASGMPGTDAADLYHKTRALLAEQWAMGNGLTQPSEVMNKNLEAAVPSNWDAFARGKARFEPIEKALHDRTRGLYESAGLSPEVLDMYDQAGGAAPAQGSVFVQPSR